MTSALYEYHGPKSCCLVSKNAAAASNAQTIKKSRLGRNGLSISYIRFHVESPDKNSNQKSDLGSRMRRVVGFFQSLGRDVRINLRRGQVRVTEQFLHAAQIRAGVQQMRRITMPQFVWREARIKPGDDQIIFQPARKLERRKRSE